MMLVDGINQVLKIGKGCCQVSELVILGIIPLHGAIRQPLFDIRWDEE
jgi:hypothetical protein